MGAVVADSAALRRAFAHIPSADPIMLRCSGFRPLVS